MMTRIWFKHSGMLAVGFGLAGLAVYLVMITVTLAHIQAITGQVPFDMRPLGYNTLEAAALLDGLGSYGRWYYLSRQIPLDTLYPALLALTLTNAILWFGRHLIDRKPVRIGIVLSVCAALFDYGENLGIAAMVLGWPTVPDPLVHLTSTASIAKSILTTLAVLLLIALAVNCARHRIADLQH